MDDVNTRRYDSSRRREQAAATRRRIIDSARKLFAHAGYAATPIRVIAEESGVAEQTVYAVFGTKRNILTAVWDTMDAQAGVEELVRNLREAGGNPARQIELTVAFDLRLFERAADIMEAARRAASADPELADALVEGHQRGRRGREQFVKTWIENGQLKPGLSLDEALDIFVGMGSYGMYHYYVVERSWPLERYRSWLAQTLQNILLADPAAG
jgi:AcrR family transcriptional regulator